MSSSDSKLYYMQVRGFSGDMLLWWRNGRCGYTTDIRQAHIFTKAEADAQQRCRPTEDFPWKKEYVDTRIRHCVSVEDIDRYEEEAL